MSRGGWLPMSEAELDGIVLELVRVHQPVTETELQMRMRAAELGVGDGRRIRTLTRLYNDGRLRLIPKAEAVQRRLPSATIPRCRYWEVPE